MGIIIRQSIKSSVVSYVGIAIGVINIVFLGARFFSPAQIGLSRVLFENALLFSSIAQLGVPYIVIKYFAHFKNRERKDHGFLTFLLIYGVIGFVFFLCLYIFSREFFVHYYQPKSPAIIDYYYFLLPIVLFTIYLNIFEAYCQVNERIVIPTFIREIFLKLANSVLILLFAVHVISFDSYLKLLIALMGIAPILLIMYLKQLGKFHIVKDFSLFTRPLLKEMVVYGLFIALGGIGNILATRIDLLMLPAMTNLQSTGIYVIALFIATVIEIPKRSISQIATPMLAEAIKSSNAKKIKELYRKTSINQLIIGSFLFLVVWCNIDAIFLLLPNTAIYSQGKYVVFFIAIARLIDMASGVNTEIILNSKYFRFGLVSIGILAFLTITSNLIFIPVYGINGAAFAASLSIFIYTIIKIIYVWIKFRLQPFTGKTLVALAICMAVYSVVYFIPAQLADVILILVSVVIKSVIISLLFFALILKLNVSEDVNHLAKTFFQKFRKSN